MIALLKKGVELTHQLDPAPTGRPAAIGGTQSKLGGTEPGTLGDIAGYNGDGGRSLRSGGNAEIPGTTPQAWWSIQAESVALAGARKQPCFHRGAAGG